LRKDKVTFYATFKVINTMVAEGKVKKTSVLYKKTLLKSSKIKNG
jgi:hypothetical protein